MSVKIAIGDRLPAFERVADLAAWNRYAAVNDEFVPIHMDDEAGRAAGHQGAIGMGNLGVSHLHCMLRKWLVTLDVSEWRILGLAVQFRGPAIRGTCTRATGEILATREVAGGLEITAAVWIEDGSGETLTKGVARSFVSTEPT